MRLLKQTIAVLGALIWGVLGVAAYSVAFAFKLLSAILTVLTIMMAGADRGARRNNRMRAMYQGGRRRGISV